VPSAVIRKRDVTERSGPWPSLIDGEAVVIGDDGSYDFRALRSRGREAVLIAFDLLEDDGSDLHDLSLVERKRRLARLISKAKKRNAIQ
jgi:bifunctional non-homologous end joining protein LigD